MLNNIIYFSNDSEHIEIKEFPSNKFSSISNLLETVFSDEKEIIIGELVPAVKFDDVEGVPNGAYQYYFITNVADPRPEHLTIVADDKKINVRGPVIFLKRRFINEKKVSQLGEPFSPKEINIFTNWFSYSFVHYKKGEEKLYSFGLMELIHEIEAMDPTHQQEIKEL